MTFQEAHETQLVTIRRATRFISQRMDYPDDVFCWQYGLMTDRDVLAASHVESSGKRWVTISELYSWMTAAPEDFLDYNPPLFPARDSLEHAFDKALHALHTEEFSNILPVADLGKEDQDAPPAAVRSKSF